MRLRGSHPCAHAPWGRRIWIGGVVIDAILGPAAGGIVVQRRGKRLDVFDWAPAAASASQSLHIDRRSQAADLTRAYSWPRSSLIPDGAGFDFRREPVSAQERLRRGAKLERTAGAAGASPGGAVPEEAEEPPWRGCRERPPPPLPLSPGPARPLPLPRRQRRRRLSRPRRRCTTPPSCSWARRLGSPRVPAPPPLPSPSPPVTSPRPHPSPASAAPAMACGATLKRTLDFDPLLSPASPKRRRCAPLSAPTSAAASPSAAAAATAASFSAAAASPQKYLRMEPSPFGDVSSRLTTGGTRPRGRRGGLENGGPGTRNPAPGMGLPGWPSSFAEVAVERPHFFSWVLWPRRHNRSGLMSKGWGSREVGRAGAVPCRVLWGRGRSFSLGWMTGMECFRSLESPSGNDQRGWYYS